MAKTLKRIKEQIANAKEKINIPKPVKQVVVGTAIGALIGAGVKQYSEHQKNEEINKEWKKQFQDADSVFADAKTAHFYASKKLDDDDVWQKRLYLNDLKRTQVELWKEQVEEQARELEEHFVWELQGDLSDAIREGDLQKIAKALEHGAVVGQKSIYSVSNPKDLFRPKKNALEIMQFIFDKYDENHVVAEHRCHESVFWGDMVKVLEARSAADSAWSGFYNKAKEKYSAAKEKDRTKEFNDKGTKKIPVVMTFGGEKDTLYVEDDQIKYEQKRKEYPTDLQYICHKHYNKLWPNGHYERSGYHSVDEKLALLDFEIQEIENIIKSGHEYEIEAKAGEKLRVESDVLQTYGGKHMRKEKADSLRNAEEPAAMKQQKRVDTIKVKDLEKGVSWTVETTTTFSSGTSLKGSESPTHSDSGNQVKEQLQKRKNIKKQYIDNER